jgi:iron(III) transport system substrate-binding protein
MFKKSLCLFFLFCALFIFPLSSRAEDDNRVVIYSTVEDFREEYIHKRLIEKFPDYNIIIEYISTGNCAAKLKAEGTDTECDIFLSLDFSYANAIKENFATLSSHYYDGYMDELVPAAKKYLVWDRWSGCIVTNSQVLVAKGLPAPKSYEDLLKPEYKGLVSMSNPKTSGTGYFFLFYLAKAWGIDRTFEYFDKLAPNVLQFTTSGSGPIKALVQGEVAVGLGMTFQAVLQRNAGVPLEITFFEEGAPYNGTTFGIIEGKQNKRAVKDVFDFLRNTLIYEDKNLFVPEKIFKEQEILVPNYPDVPYADMTGIDSEEIKKELLERWTY